MQRGALGQPLATEGPPQLLPLRVAIHRTPTSTISQTHWSAKWCHMGGKVGPKKPSFHRPLAGLCVLGPMRRKEMNIFTSKGQHRAPYKGSNNRHGGFSSKVNQPHPTTNAGLLPCIPGKEGSLFGEDWDPPPCSTSNSCAAA